jgi:hypothetical protein
MCHIHLYPEQMTPKFFKKRHDPTILAALKFRYFQPGRHLLLIFELGAACPPYILIRYTQDNKESLQKFIFLQNG